MVACGNCNASTYSSSTHTTARRNVPWQKAQRVWEMCARRLPRKGASRFVINSTWLYATSGASRL